MRTVAANVQDLIIWNRSMAVTLEMAEGGNQGVDEDAYFVEKLRKSAAVLGYSLTLCKEPKKSPLADIAFDEAIEEGRLSNNPKDDNYAGKYMYMGEITGRATFKNINTREYDV